MEGEMTETPTVAPKHAGLLIDGAWGESRSGKTFDDLAPATGEPLAAIAAAGADDVAAAVASASHAFRAAAWARISPTERGHVLYRIADLIRQHVEELALLEAADVGKLLADARGEVEHTADIFEYYAGAANKVLGETFAAGPDKLAYGLREPLGVVAAIVPWNYPLPLAAMKVAPALAVGNAVVLKPPAEAPLSALALGQIALEAGLPAGLLNVVPGFGEEAGQPLAEHPDVAMVAFTGSTVTGRKIMLAAAGRIAKVDLELGGKSPHIVLPDAALDDFTTHAAIGLFKNAGQDCCAGTRMLVHREILDEVVERLKASAEAQRVGDPLADASVTMGPLINQRQRSRVHAYTTEALVDGGKLVTGGTELVDGRPDESSFYAPTLFTDVAPESRIFQEEVFGPVGVVVAFRDETEAIELANATKYGLAAAIWTNDLSTAHRVASQVQAGMVWINDYHADVMELPFGAFKQSGIGRVYSQHALDAYCNVKQVSVRLDRQAT
jgi:acyl-CoA reductase-like NAD-dependent aldehyde dehydrogenase